MKSYKQLAFAVAVIGAINWGLVGFLNLNLVSTLFGSDTVVTKVVYMAVGLSGIFLFWEKYGGAKAKK